MPTVSVSVADLGPDTPTNPLHASFSVSLHTPVYDPAGILTTREFQAEVRDGAAEWFWVEGRVYRVRANNLRGLSEWFILAPDRDITLAELITEHQVDPGTLAPSIEPPAAWVLEIERLASEVADLTNAINWLILGPDDPIPDGTPSGAIIVRVP